MNVINVTLADGATQTCAVGTVVGDLAEARCGEDGLPYVGALVNNDVVSLSYPLSVNVEVRFLTMSDPHGWRVYRRSLCFALTLAVKEVFPEADFKIEHSFGAGLYCSLHCTPESSNGPTESQLKALKAGLDELIAQDVPIERHKVSYLDAVKKLEGENTQAKLKLLTYRNPPRVVIHSCRGFSDLAHGPLVRSTGALCCFELLPYEGGLVLHFSLRTAPEILEPFVDQPHLFQIFKEHKEWGRILGVDTVGRLNEIIAMGGLKDFVRTAEALHEKKVARIADAIAARPGTKVILIAGPSSAGKTTFAKRLTVHLTVNGLRPVIVGTDDYFVGSARNPVDEHGKPDYEHIEAVDIDLFNKDLGRLIDGEEVELPRFNFETKQREYDGVTLKVDDDQIIIIEGIHGLNPRLTEQIPDDRKYRIYVSALTQLSVDSHNRISTTDNRLMRRMVRDGKFRGHSPLDTLHQWPSVRRGEKRWIFPFQREADATFNSALDYELAVLKPLVEPLLMRVKPTHPEYAEARRLSEFLLNFVGAESTCVPPTSLLREYIGGSDFRY